MFRVLKQSKCETCLTAMVKGNFPSLGPHQSESALETMYIERKQSERDRMERKLDRLLTEQTKAEPLPEFSS